MESTFPFFLGIASTFFGGIALLLLGLHLFEANTGHTAISLHARWAERTAQAREPASGGAKSGIVIPLRSTGRRTSAYLKTRRRLLP